MIRKMLLTTVTVGAMTFAAAHAAEAASTTASTTGARASISYSPGSWGDITGGRLYDADAGDSKCARLYERGYNLVLGWTDWHLQATVCAGGSTPLPAVHYSVYSDHAEVKVCSGYTTCSVKRLW